MGGVGGVGGVGRGGRGVSVIMISVCQVGRMGCVEFRCGVWAFTPSLVPPSSLPCPPPHHTVSLGKLLLAPWPSPPPPTTHTNTLSAPVPLLPPSTHTHLEVVAGPQGPTPHTHLKVAAGPQGPAVPLQQGPQGGQALGHGTGKAVLATTPMQGGALGAGFRQWEGKAGDRLRAGASVQASKQH